MQIQDSGQNGMSGDDKRGQRPRRNTGDQRADLRRTYYSGQFQMKRDKRDFQNIRSNRRNNDALQLQMATLALSDPSNFVATPDPAIDVESEVDLRNPGLTRAQLEGQRWKVSAPVAESTFSRFGLKLDGRAARKIYAWPLIFRLEGVSEKLSTCASTDTYPILFEDLIDAKAASVIMGISQAHLRKMVDAGQLCGCDIIRLGARRMYRFRPSQIEAAARHQIMSRLVGGAFRCA